MATRMLMEMPLAESLSTLVERCQQVSYRDEFFTQIYPQLQRLVVHDKFACGIVSMRDSRVLEYIHVDFPFPLLESLGVAGEPPCPFFHLWKRALQPVLFSLTDSDPETVLDLAQPWVPIYRRLGLRNLAAHGVLDVSQQAASYFGFSRRESWTDQDIARLKMVVPHLHCALSRLAFRSQAGSVDAQAGAILSVREREVLGWICLGKSNLEIATLLGISFWTVKIHVSNLLRKLGVANRSQAVARAAALDLVSPDTLQRKRHAAAGGYDTSENLFIKQPVGSR